MQELLFERLEGDANVLVLLLTPAPLLQCSDEFGAILLQLQGQAEFLEGGHRQPAPVILVRVSTEHAVQLLLVRIVRAHFLVLIG